MNRSVRCFLLVRSPGTFPARHKVRFVCSVQQHGVGIQRFRYSIELYIALTQSRSSFVTNTTENNPIQATGCSGIAIIYLFCLNLWIVLCGYDTGKMNTPLNCDFHTTTACERNVVLTCPSKPDSLEFIWTPKMAVIMVATNFQFASSLAIDICKRKCHACEQSFLFQKKSFSDECWWWQGKESDDDLRTRMGCPIRQTEATLIGVKRNSLINLNSLLSNLLKSYLVQNRDLLQLQMLQTPGTEFTM